jgi:hypothetical protein
MENCTLSWFTRQGGPATIKPAPISTATTTEQLLSRTRPLSCIVTPFMAISYANNNQRYSSLILMYLGVPLSCGDVCQGETEQERDGKHADH